MSSFKVGPKLPYRSDPQRLSLERPKRNDPSEINGLALFSCCIYNNPYNDTCLYSKFIFLGLVKAGTQRIGFDEL